jgi:hypothetical protein
VWNRTRFGGLPHPCITRNELSVSVPTSDQVRRALRYCRYEPMIATLAIHDVSSGNRSYPRPSQTRAVRSAPAESTITTMAPFSTRVSAQCCTSLRTDSSMPRASTVGNSRTTKRRLLSNPFLFATHTALFATNVAAIRPDANKHRASNNVPTETSPSSIKRNMPCPARARTATIPARDRPRLS